MIFGAVFWSVYADKRGRRSAYLASLACIFLAGLASAFAPSALWLVAFRIVVGFGVGGSLPVTTILVSEFLPTNHRSDVICRLSGLFWGSGLVSASVLGLVLNRAIGSSPGWAAVRATRGLDWSRSRCRFEAARRVLSSRREATASRVHETSNPLYTVAYEEDIRRTIDAIFEA